MLGKSQAISQTIIAQRKSAAGTATNSPRAKLRLGPTRGGRGAERFSVGDLVMAITLSIIGHRVLPLEDLIQSANREPRRTTRGRARSVSGAARQPPGRSIGRILTGAAGLPRVALQLAANRPCRHPARQRVIHVPSGRIRPRKSHLTPRLAIFLALFATPRMATAQADVATPTSMFEPEKGRGMPVSGGLLLFNRTLLQGEYDTNIYNVDQNRSRDTIAVLNSDFRVATRLPRHELAVEAGLGIRRYADTTDENSETYHVDGRALLDLGDRIDLRASGGYARGFEMRGTAGDQFATDRPVRFDDTHFEATIDRTGGILEASLSGSLQGRKYLDASVNGLPVNLEDRDVKIRKAVFQAGYRISPVMRLYAQVGGNEVEYDRDLPGASRNSSGYSALAGLRYEVTRLVDLTAAVGYIHQSFDAPGIPAVSGINYRLQTTWTPTPMWRLTASGERAVDASPLNNVPAIVRSSADVKVQRALGDRVLIEAAFTYIDEDYHGLDRNDRRFAGSADVQYRVTNNIAAIVGAGYRKQTSGMDGRSYSGASIKVGLRVAL